MIDFVKFDVPFLNKTTEWLNDEELRFLIDAEKPSRLQQISWYDSLVSREDYKIWGVCLDSEPIGVCGFKHNNGDSLEYFGYIGEKQFWGKNLGHFMLEFIESEARKHHVRNIYMYVINMNFRAIKLYMNLGYKIIDVKKGYLVKMEKQL